MQYVLELCDVAQIAAEVSFQHYSCEVSPEFLQRCLCNATAVRCWLNDYRGDCSMLQL